MNNEKKHQRGVLRRKRNTLSKAEVVRLSETICELVYDSPDWSKYRKIHIYLPITKNNEVNTWPLINRLWAQQPEVQISTSVYKQSRSLRHVIINSGIEIQDDEQGIPTPISNYQQKDSSYDLIIVPVLGFDEKLNRLGYGRGVYDMFLAQHEAALKIGFAYEMLKLGQIENETHDVALDEVATEKRLYIVGA